MTAASRAPFPPSGTVLRRALIAWGLGDLALGRRRAGVTWLVAELLAAAAVVYLVAGLWDTTAYLVPYLAGTAFLATWAAQAAVAYHRARSARGAIGPTPVGSPAAAIAWLSVPLLVWGTGFWLVGGQSATPAAVLDQFETRWPALSAGGSIPAEMAIDPSSVSAAARQALATLALRCPGGSPGTCTGELASRLRDVRMTVTDQSGETATAVAQVVAFEQRPSKLLWFITGTDLVPVPQETVLTLTLRAIPAPLPGGIDVGARRWQIVNARPSA